MAKAEFKTGYHQREIVLDVKVAADLEVGDLIFIGNSNAPEGQRDTDTIYKAAGTGNTALTNADYIVAQSDMTMEYGHANVEGGDYRYSKNVAASAGAKKKVAVYFIVDESDIIVK